MSSTLIVRKTPKNIKELCSFKLPFKAIIARKFYGHDGSLGGEEITIGAEHLNWLKGVLDAGNFDESERKNIAKMITALEEGDTLDMWFEC